MKKPIFLLSLFYFSIACADSPGKKNMYESKISIRNTDHLIGYDFYWSMEGDSATVFNHDSSFTIPGSAGRPMNAALWAVNKKTNLSTDTLFFSNYYAPDYLITFDSVSAGNKLVFIKSSIANSNEGGDSGDKEAGESNSRAPSRMMLFAGISLAALVLLVVLFIRRKNANEA